jgi:Trypsin
LIRLDRVLTAGHCVPNRLAGTVFFGNVNRNQGTQRSFVTDDIVLHPSYSSGTGTDIAVIRLSVPYVASAFIATIALPTSPLERYENRQGIMQGFGNMAGGVTAPILQWTHFNTLSVAECTAAVGNRAMMMCGRYPHASTCAGDSGGGFVYFEAGEWRVIGVHSVRFGSATCTPNDIAGSVRVNDHLSFIMSV